MKTPGPGGLKSAFLRRCSCSFQRREFTAASQKNNRAQTPAIVSNGKNNPDEIWQPWMRLSCSLHVLRGSAGIGRCVVVIEIKGCFFAIIQINSQFSASFDAAGKLPWSFEILFINQAWKAVDNGLWCDAAEREWKAYFVIEILFLSHVLQQLSVGSVHYTKIWSQCFHGQAHVKLLIQFLLNEYTIYMTIIYSRLLWRFSSV